MEDLSPRKPPQLAIKAEDTSPAGENGALVWSTNEGRLITYNEDAERWGVPSMLPALSTIKVPPATYFSFVDLTNNSGNTFFANVQYFVPFYLPNMQTISTLAYHVTNQATSGYARVGIYNTEISGNAVKPNQLIVSTSNMNITSTGIKTASVTPTTLYAGVIYWASFLATSNVTLRASNSITRLVTTASLFPIFLLQLSNSSGSLYNTISTNPVISDITLVPILVYT